MQLKIIEDLGTRPVGKKNAKMRYLLVECHCGHQFECQHQASKTQKECRACGYITSANKRIKIRDKRIQNIYHNIITRTSNKNNKDYPSYGGRGIFLCDEWKNDSTTFEKWTIDNGYTAGLTIDRKNNDKGYSPENCRWVTPLTQANNRKQQISKHQFKSGKYYVYVSYDNKRHYVGGFKTKEEADIAFSDKKKELRGY